MPLPSTITPTEHDTELSKAALPVLAAYLSKSNVNLRLVGSNLGDVEEADIELPRIALEVVHQILHQFVNGNAFMLTMHSKELTTQQAADMLMVSRPFVIKLLENNEIDHRKVGAHRRVDLLSLIEYQARSTVNVRGSTRKLTELAEEMGGYGD